MKMGDSLDYPLIQGGFEVHDGAMLCNVVVLLPVFLTLLLPVNISDLHLQVP